MAYGHVTIVSSVCDGCVSYVSDALDIIKKGSLKDVCSWWLIHIIWSDKNSASRVSYVSDALDIVKPASSLCSLAGLCLSYGGT